MKKICSIILTLIMALSCCTMSAYADMSIKKDYCPNGKVSTPDAPYVDADETGVNVWVTQPNEILNLGSEIMMNSGYFYDSNYEINSIKAYKEIDLSIDGGAWFSTTSKAINSELLTYDSSFLTSEINDVYTVDKLVGIPVIDTTNYVVGDSINNGILNGKITNDKKIDYTNHKFSFRVRYRLEIGYQSGAKETVYSDWSAATSVGKGAAAQTNPALSSKPAAPTINVAESFTNSSGAQVYIGLDIPESVYRDELHYFTNNREPDIYNQVQYKLSGEDWKDAGVGVPSGDVSGSTIDDFFSFVILGARDGETVQIRVRTVEPDGRVSDWSNTATISVTYTPYINPNPKKYGSGNVTPEPAKPEPAIKTMTEGATVTQVDKFVQSLKSEADPKGTKFSFLVAKQKKATKNSITFTWKKAKGASYYVVYGAKCGKNAYKKIKKVKTNTFTQKKLKKGTYYKYVVAAFDKNNKLLGSCNTLHIVTSGGKYCNLKKVTTAAKKNKIVLAKKGKTFKLKAKALKENKLKVNTHRKIRYESTNKKIATVDSKGKITAKKKGTCYIYAYAQNGANAKIKVTVKK